MTEKQVEEIAKQKMPDLNAASLETAIKSIKGTARIHGIEWSGSRGVETSIVGDGQSKHPLSKTPRHHAEV